MDLEFTFDPGRRHEGLQAVPIVFDSYMRMRNKASSQPQRSHGGGVDPGRSDDEGPFRLGKRLVAEVEVSIGMARRLAQALGRPRPDSPQLQRSGRHRILALYPDGRLGGPDLRFFQAGPEPGPRIQGVASRWGGIVGAVQNPAIQASGSGCFPHDRARVFQAAFGFRKRARRILFMREEERLGSGAGLRPLWIRRRGGCVRGKRAEGPCEDHHAAHQQQSDQ